MKKSVKALLLVLCAVVLVVATVFTTLAFLKAETGTLTNTFTVGNVSIGLKETEVNQYGQVFDTNGDGSTVLDASTNNQGNTYKLIPGQTYTKDPTVTFQAGSEKSYVFVDVTINETVAGLVAEGNNGLKVDTAEGKWTKLPDVDNVYYQVVDSAEGKDLPVFASSTFTLTSDFGDAVISETGETVTIKAYAIQYEGFEGNVNSAWTSLQAELTT